MKNCKKLFIVLALTALLIAALCASAFAAEIVDSGQCGENATWTLDSDGVLTISGTGEMWDWTESNSNPAPWYKNRSIIKSVTISDSVTTIGDYAFYYCTSLTNVTIGNGVTTIGDFAFHACTSLTSVTIPDSVTTIGGDAFHACTSLIGIWVDENNPNYSSDSFGVLFNKNKSELIQAPGAITKYTIPDSVTTIGDLAFYYCTSLTSVTIPDSVTTIGGYAFEYCTSLTSVTIPDSVTTIGGYAFYYCTSLTSVTIGNGVTTIGGYAFHACTSLIGIWVDENNPNYSSDSFGVLFNKNKSELIQAPGAITKYTIPDSVTTIGGYAFEDCTSLTSVTIPDSVTTIGDHAFWDCTSLKDVYYGGTEAQWNKIDIGVDNECLTNATIHYNSGTATGHIITSKGENGTRIFTFNEGEEVENLVLDTIATIYNPRLAHFLSNMARSAYDESLLADNYSELGIDVLYHNNFGDENPFAGYYIGKRTLWDGSEMVFITIRGTANSFQWGTDFTMGTSISFGGWYDGFEICVNRLYNNLKSQLGGTIPTKNIRYVITGHSLGAAVGNLLATKLNEDGVPKYNVYDYNFACPDVANDWGWAWNHNGEHDNIFNIGNCQDIITFVPGILLDAAGPVWLQWGKYGQSLWFSENWNNLDYVMLNPPTHDMVYYVDYLAKERPFSEFRDYNGVHGEILKNQVKTVLYIQCPVDVTVYNSGGVPVAGVTGGEVNYYDSEVGDVLIFLSGDEKYIMLPDDNYTVSLTATDDGTMTFTQLTVDPVSGESYGGTQFADVELTKGEGFLSETSTSKDTTLYTTDSSGNKAKEIKGEAVYSVTPVVPGDVNGDNELTNSDLVTVARYIVGLCDENTARIVEYMADMDGDNIVDNTDLVTVARWIVGL